MNQLSLYPGLLFWLTLFCSFVRLNEDFPLVSNKNMSVKEIDGSALEGVSICYKIKKVLDYLPWVLYIYNILLGWSNYTIISSLVMSFGATNTNCQD